jgi:hypothetical protein
VPDAAPFRIPGRVAALLLAAAAASQPSAAAVFGRDDRTPLTGASAALSQKVGVLTSSKSGAICTAFCLSPDIIATAAHCVFGVDGDHRPALRDLRFNLKYDRTRAITEIAGGDIDNQEQHVVAGSRRLSLTPPISAANDWAVVRLRSPVCRAGGLQLIDDSRATQVTPEAFDRGVYQVGVHRDVAEDALLISPSCKIDATGATERALARDFLSWRSVTLHGCDTGGGSSGSPMLQGGDGAPVVVGMNVGVYVAPRAAVPAAGGEVSPRAPIANTAISVAAMNNALKAIAGRDLLSTPSEIARVQTGLAKRAFFNSAPTGRVDAALVDAVRAYERSAGAPVTGLLTHSLLEQLERSVRAAAPR